MNPPVLANEAERLRALQKYHILDTPPDIAFERLIRLAAQLFQVPIALVSLVDADRLWFKARFGLGTLQAGDTKPACAYCIGVPHAGVLH